MVIFLSILPVVLLAQSVFSANLYKSRRISSGFELDKLSLHLNRPPLMDHFIPVTVLYDDEENMHVLSRKVDRNIKDFDHSSLTQQPELKFGNHPPVVEEYDHSQVFTINKDEMQDIEANSTNQSVNNQKDQMKSSNNETINMKKVDTTTSTLVPKSRSLNIENNTLAVLQIQNRENLQQKSESVINEPESNKNQSFNNKSAETTSVKSDQTKVTPSQNENKFVTKGRPTRTSFQKRTQPRDPVVPIIDSENYVYAYNGDYHYRYKGGDGTSAFEKGELKTVSEGSTGAGVVGGFSYTDKEGNDFSLSYTADENGYRPIGAHLPTPPPIPPAIQRALAFLATKTTPEPITERINGN